MANILLGVSSSIAIYKALDLVSSLKKEGHVVYAMLSVEARKMVSPLLFENLSGVHVSQDIDDNKNPPTMEHIRLAKLADILVYAPATANIIGKLAHGIADDLMSTVYLCVGCPVVVFPAMNPAMWHHQATQANVTVLQKRGVEVSPPAEGVVACGDEGRGKLAAVETMKKKISEILEPEIKDGKAFNPAKWRGKKVLLTAGGTSEAIDPVRMITNRSSGKIAYALAQRLKALDVDLTYLYGQIQTEIPRGCRALAFESSEDLLHKVQSLIEEIEVLIMAAAPSDYKVVRYSEQKLKKKGSWTLELIETPDILSSLKKKANQCFVGFAAETQDIKENAAKKLAQKNLDLIVGNPVGGASQKIGMGEDYTELTLLNQSGLVWESGVISKTEAAAMIVRAIEKLI